MKFTTDELNSVMRMCLRNMGGYFSTKQLGLPLEELFPEYSDTDVMQDFTIVLQFISKCREHHDSETSKLIEELYEIMSDSA